MGYLHINNLHKDPTMLAFKECWALEKVHGTSAHVSYHASTGVPAKLLGGGGEHVSFSGGAAKAGAFEALFDKAKLLEAFAKLGHDQVTVCGEAYGGGGAAGQGMSATYGKTLQFIAFDVKIGDGGFGWLDVPDAVKVVEALGLEFVPYYRTECVPANLDAMRDAPSEVAVRRGMGGDKVREGIVIRPINEMMTRYGHRIIAKHRCAAFEERENVPKVSATLTEADIAAKARALSDADAIATEWVTDTRLKHVLDKAGAGGAVLSTADTGDVVKAMQEDVYREGGVEVVRSKESDSAIGRKTAGMFHAWLKTAAATPT